MAAKADYVMDQGAGGTMIWELAGSPSSSPSSTPGTCTAPSWNADTVYLDKGFQVSWKGRTYTNRWWSLNEDPPPAARTECGPTTGPADPTRTIPEVRLASRGTQAGAGSQVRSALL